MKPRKKSKMRRVELIPIERSTLPQWDPEIEFFLTLMIPQCPLAELKILSKKEPEWGFTLELKGKDMGKIIEVLTYVLNAARRYAQAREAKGGFARIEYPTRLND